MKGLFLSILSILFFIAATAQQNGVRISALPMYTNSADNAIVPVTVNGITYGVYGYQLSNIKPDSVSISATLDSLFEWRRGVKLFRGKLGGSPNWASGYTTYDTRYILNGTSLQTGAGFNIDGTAQSAKALIGTSSFVGTENLHVGGGVQFDGRATSNTVMTTAGVNVTPPTFGTTQGEMHMRVISSTGTTNWPAITVGANDISGAQGGIYFNINSGFGTRLHFATTDNTTTGAQSRMYINEFGQTAIGATSFANFEKLRVNGSVYIDSSIRVGNLLSDPGNSVNGMAYYNTTSNLFRGYVNGAWRNFATAGSNDFIQNNNSASQSANAWYNGSLNIGSSTFRPDFKTNIEGNNTLLRLSSTSTNPQIKFSNTTDTAGTIGYSGITLQFGTQGSVRATMSAAAFTVTGDIQGSNQIRVGSSIGSQYQLSIPGKGIFGDKLFLTTNGVGVVDASGTDITGSALHISAGKSTGAANGGAIEFWTTPSGTAGSTLNTESLRASILGSNGNFVLNGGLHVLSNLSADPTGVNGGVYYSTTTPGIRAYINGSWQNVATTTSQQTEAFRTVTSTNYTLLSTDRNVTYEGSPSGGTITFPASPVDGQVYWIRNESGALVNYSVSVWQNSTTSTASAAAGKLHKIVYSATDSKWHLILSQ